VSGEFLIVDHRGGQRVRPEGAVPVKEGRWRPDCGAEEGGEEEED
jgi:hypothetical protein